MKQTFLGALGLAAGIASAGLADGPAETPAEGYAAARYVDSAGCAFSRVTIGAEVFWAPQIGADGAALCGLTPTVQASPDADALPSIPPTRRASAPEFPEDGRYVQAGAFADPDNAARIIGQMQALGLTVLRQDYPRGSGTLRVLYAGPLGDAAAAARALGAVRNLGLRDAFLWEQSPPD